ncbi:RDD family protein [Glaciimonas immobilis]|uniref:Putative RDD family membrane protein YckC n=1 Tax=Glaciimonas immobilis TaxID=728004 RepID=A0A840RX70_9BURK|nr:RDD family protein [Glaciimonas immobilis]MBB5202495.1 putative RDD family membrane protein YckC [Glaciimonas immobilis]
MNSSKSAVTPVPTSALTPSLKRRFGSMLYEAMLLFGILFIAGLIFSTLLQQRNAMYLRHAQQVWLFVVMTAYFVWCWSHGGQTLAMKTWRLRLINKDGSAIRTKNAVVRYLLAWFWFLPGLALAWALGAQAWMLAIIPALNVILWALTAYLDPERQFLHDRLAGTKLVDMAEIEKPEGKRRWYH